MVGYKELVVGLNNARTTPAHPTLYFLNRFGIIVDKYKNQSLKVRKPPIGGNSHPRYICDILTPWLSCCWATCTQTTWSDIGLLVMKFTFKMVHFENRNWSVMKTFHLFTLLQKLHGRIYRTSSRTVNNVRATPSHPTLFSQWIWNIDKRKNKSQNVGKPQILIPNMCIKSRRTYSPPWLSCWRAAYGHQ